MRKKGIEIANLFILCVLSIGNVVFIRNDGFHDDSLLMFVLATVFFLLYVFGRVFPNMTVKFIHRICIKLYKNSDTIDIPVFVEAKRTFQKRLPYILVCCNICLFISLLIYSTVRLT